MTATESDELRTSSRNRSNFLSCRLPEPSDIIALVNPVQDDSQRFREIFDAHPDPLQRFVYSYVGSRNTAADIVHDAFLQLWVRLQAGEPVRDVKAYLYTTAGNQALNYLRHRRIEVRHQAISQHA